MDRKVVCVTGGSGYIASWLIKFLLKSGYTVNATVRNTDDPKKTAHLLALEGAKERLHLLKANLLEEGSFDAAVDGCEAVFHTASPVSFTATDPQTELIDPAVEGTLNVLRSCVKASSIKKVIITSSFASIPFNGRPLNPDVIVDETWFSDPATCKQQKLWYPLAKTLAEEAAWKFAKEHNIELVTLHPVYTIGPLLQPTLNFSVEIIPNLLNGAQEYPNGYYPTVDVRDVAYAHIRALEMSSAAGRYCLVERSPHFSEILNIVHQLYPSLRLPQKCGSETAIFYQISNEKAKTLGINFIPLEVSLKDTVESLKEKNFLSI